MSAPNHPDVLSEGQPCEAHASAGHDGPRTCGPPRDAAAIVADVEAACTGRERRLTPMRRRVLEALARRGLPLGAYDIIDLLGRHGDRPAPISVYRALDFLVAEGFVHRLESRNAFLICKHRHGAGETVVFLICERCGSTAEASSPELQRAVHDAAAGQGFLPRAPVIEVPGLCATCRRL
ncbi:transcriptional repressor [Blastochloris viridis]|nr:transcriptional repressor [Blastochloris viridis]ALK08007.1 Zinc uptake regulation protein [Blastochloris viridis]CUU43929.1 Zinc uptake regulation protein [Blastochloris viridis]